MAKISKNNGSKTVDKDVADPCWKDSSDQDQNTSREAKFDSPAYVTI
jgi:hypothetical protein